jgi:hypothetical protein
VDIVVLDIAVSIAITMDIMDMDTTNTAAKRELPLGFATHGNIRTMS